MAEQAAAEEQAVAPKEPQWRLGDLGVGGRLHFSLPKGLEEDFTVTRRDRVIWPDEQVEYDARLAGEDPNHQVWLHWWTMGVRTYAWMLEADEHTMEDIGLTPERLQEMRNSGHGDLVFRDQRYRLDSARRLVIFEGGLRPGKEVSRWDFRNDADTRQIVIQRHEKGEEQYHVLVGTELWLRDVNILQARGSSPASSSSTPATGAGDSPQM